MNIPIQVILPIENPKFHNGEDLSELRNIFNYKGILPLPIGVPYEKKIILCDGHKRVIKDILKGDTIPTIRVLETDLDIHTYGTGAVLSQYRTLKEFTNWYTETIKPEMEENGIEYILDYPLFRNIKRTLKQIR